MQSVSAVDAVFKPLNESPSEKEGKSVLTRQGREPGRPSMKVPPKRKGNFFPFWLAFAL